MADKFYIPVSPPPTAPPYDGPTPPTQPYPAASPSPTHPHPPPMHHDDAASSPSKPEHTPRAERIVTSLSALLFSLLTISLSYAAVFPSGEIYRLTIAPLATSTVFLFFAIVSVLYLCTIPGRYAKLAILPIVFAAVSGAMIILLNVAAKALTDGGFVKINSFAVALSAGVFGGIALGTSAAFLLFTGGFGTGGFGA